MRTLKILFGILCIQLCCGSAWAATAAGTASIVAGPVSARSAEGVSRALAKDDAVYAGDRIVTGQGGYVRLGFVDGGSMVLRPNTEFAIEGFRFQPVSVEPATATSAPAAAGASPATAPASALTIGNQQGLGNQAFFRLIRGGFRAVSGLVGKLNREEYAVRTPVATIGIRGTVFWSVVCDAVCAADPVVKGVLTTGEEAAGGTVSAVDQGSIVMVSSAGKSVVVNNSEFMFTTAGGTHLALPGLPGFMAGESWLNTPEPAAATANSSPLADGNLSVVPAVGSVAATLLIGAVVLATDSDDGSGASLTPGTTTTSTTSTGR